MEYAKCYVEDKMNILIEDKERIAIVVVGYNRQQSLSRLMSSLLQANYDDVSVPLFISIDCSNDHGLYDYVKKIVWPYGNKYVNIQNERLGLKEHIMQCGDLSQHFKAIILLEDDIYVGEYFYNYAIKKYFISNFHAVFSSFNKSLNIT